MHYHRLPARGWAALSAALAIRQRLRGALRNHRHDVTMGFDKTWGQDVLYPQGGLHVASAATICSSIRRA
jgi:UDP-glucose:(heptosyl)LPS alpha-1,3-glucosyltransferase